MKVIEGDLVARDVQIAIVAGRFNEVIVNALIEGARDALMRHGMSAKNIDLIKVPGAFEIPLAAKVALTNDSYAAVICLGAVIRGATPHFDIVANESAKGLSAIALDHGMPIINGILTTDSIEQTIERAGTKAGNKGGEAAATAIEMASIFQQLD